MTRDLTPEEDAIVTDGIEPERRFDWVVWLEVCACIAGALFLVVALWVRTDERQPVGNFRGQWPCRQGEVLVIDPGLHAPEVRVGDLACRPR
jgi:hypothetical protein